MPAATRSERGDERWRQRLVQKRRAECDAEERRQEGEGGKQRSRIGADQREPRDIGDRRDPDRLVEEGRQDREGEAGLDALAEQRAESADPEHSRDCRADRAASFPPRRVRAPSPLTSDDRQCPRRLPRSTQSASPRSASARRQRRGRRRRRAPRPRKAQPRPTSFRGAERLAKREMPAERHHERREIEEDDAARGGRELQPPEEQPGTPAPNRRPTARPGQSVPSARRPACARSAHQRNTSSAASSRARRPSATPAECPRASP